MCHLMDVSFLNGQHTLFGYGCGRDDNLRLLGESNVTAAGWDPVFRPESERGQAAIVNLGFVLNVIEDAVERQETLQSTFELATKVLAVSVMLAYGAKR